MKMLLNSKKGMTLMELVVAAGITAVIAGIVLSSLIGFSKFFLTEMAAADIRSKANLSLSKMVRELRQASPDTFARDLSVADNHIISFHLPTGWDLNEGTLIYNIGNQPIQYSRNGDLLVRTDLETGAIMVLSDHVVSFEITDEAPYEISLQFQRDTYFNSITFGSRDTFELRNEF
ncbi:type II secretion system protein J [Candidatus Omnitrophota bacterium]